ncbi:unnamed protein product [Pylaiella littoralis]
MLQFVLAVAGYLFLVTRFFDRGVAPIGKRLQRNLIPVPKKSIEMVTLFASMLYPMLAFLKARESGWQAYESRGALAVIAGVVIGMISNAD